MITMPKLTKTEVVWKEKAPYMRQGQEVREHSQRYHIKPSPVLPFKYRQRILRGEAAIQSEEDIKDLFKNPPPIVLETMIAEESAEKGRPLTYPERVELRNQAALAIMKRAQIEEEETKALSATLRDIHKELRGQRKQVLKQEALKYDVKGDFVKEFMRPDFRDKNGFAHFLIDGREYVVAKDELRNKWHVFEKKPDGSLIKVFKRTKGFSNEYMAWRNALNRWGMNPARIWEETNTPEKREKLEKAQRRVINQAEILQSLLNRRVDSLGGTKKPKVTRVGNWIKIQGTGPRGSLTTEQMQAIRDLGFVRKNGELITSIRPKESKVMVSEALDKVAILEVSDRKKEAESLWLALHPSKVKREGEWTKKIQFIENTKIKAYELKFQKKPPKKIRDALKRIGFDHSKSERYWLIPRREISPQMLAVVENKIVGYIPARRPGLKSLKREPLVTEVRPTSLGRVQMRKAVRPLRPKKIKKKEWQYFARWGKKRTVSFLREDRADKVLENIKRDPQHYAKLGKSDPRTLRRLYRVPAHWSPKIARKNIEERDPLVKLVYDEKKVKI